MISLFCSRPNLNLKVSGDIALAINRSMFAVCRGMLAHLSDSDQHTVLPVAPFRAAPTTLTPKLSKSIGAGRYLEFTVKLPKVIGRLP